jgi:hypothetical protein
VVAAPHSSMFSSSLAAAPHSSMLYGSKQHTLPQPMQGVTALQGAAAAAADMWVYATAAVLDGPGLPVGQP